MHTATGMQRAGARRPFLARGQSSKTYMGDLKMNKFLNMRVLMKEYFQRLSSSDSSVTLCGAIPVSVSSVLAAAVAHYARELSRTDRSSCHICGIHCCATTRGMAGWPVLADRKCVARCCSSSLFLLGPTFVARTVSPLLAMWASRARLRHCALATCNPIGGKLDSIQSVVLFPVSSRLFSSRLGPHHTGKYLQLFGP